VIRVGIGYDLHRLVAGRRFVLGGVDLDFELGPQGHSDADPLLHAIIDALLGAAGLGDIGGLFPSSDPRWKDADSAALLAEVMARLDAGGWRVENVDANVVLERPRLAPHVPALKARIASLLHTSAERVSVKAKTAEGLGPVGEGRAVEAQAVVLIERLGQAG
jgi:2-C-methyl-D-erythritol 2,4-cyclodiphosphate synthase